MGKVLLSSLLAISLACVAYLGLLAPMHHTGHSQHFDCPFNMIGGVCISPLAPIKNWTGDVVVVIVTLFGLGLYVTNYSIILHTLRPRNTSPPRRKSLYTYLFSSGVLHSKAH